MSVNNQFPVNRITQDANTSLDSDEIQNIQTNPTFDENAFKVFYTNADSLLNKRDELLVKVLELKPEIIQITETLPKIELMVRLTQKLNLLSQGTN